MEQEIFIAHIKEHFLFNSLNCAVSLCRNNPEEASKLLISLSECLHYATNHNKDIVMLEEEIQYVKSYLYIQSIRFNSRVFVEWDALSKLEFPIKPYTLFKPVDSMLSKLLKESYEPLKIRITVKEEETAIILDISINNISQYRKLLQI